MRPVASTASLPEASRATAWQCAMRRWLAPVEVTPRAAEPFEGSIEALELGYVRLLTVEADPMRVSRTARTAAGAPADQLALLIQMSGRTALHQDGRGTEAGPGEMALLALGRPFVLEQRERSRVRLLRVPAQALGHSGAGVPRLTGRVIPPGAGVAALLGPFVAGLAASAGGTTAPLGERLGGHVADLLATLVDEFAVHHGADHTRADGHPLLRSIRRYIDAHLRDPGLSPERVARAHGISVRYLHRLFESEDTTVRRLIQRRRVEECGRELLRRARAEPSISAVAHGWGFQNPAHFSRAFKAVYGHSPRRWLRAGPDAPGGDGDVRAQATGLHVQDRTAPASRHRMESRFPG
ncbi:helix-turn-helix domain-containing protein [Streptomyces sp. NPDC052023]|uniref:AraC-like ligand-binding domain-containing protein n=1 Tax=Streptomyces sp. NPDC052023 TaxID=3365681 RepID=UPI0037D2DBA8